MEKIKKAGGFILRDIVFNGALFRIVMVVVALVCAVPFIHMEIGRYVKLLLVWGAVVLVYDAFTRRLCFKSKYALLFLWFSLSYFITVLLNENKSDNFAQLCYMIVFMFLLYSYDLKESREQKWRELKIVAYLVIGITFFLSAVSFVTFMFSVNRTYQQNGSDMFIGMFENRLWGLYNPNTGSTLNMISIILSMLFLYKENSARSTKVFLWFNVVLQWLCLVLTQSRTAWYTMVIFFGIFVFFRITCLHRVGQIKGLVQIAVRLTASVVVVVLLLISHSPVKKVLSYVPGTIEYVKVLIKDEQPEPPAPPNKIEPIDIGRVEEEEDRPGGVTNGRIELWKGGLKVFLQHPLFGVGRENIPDAAKEFVPEYWHNNLDRGSLHNIYLTTLVSAGIMGFIPLALFVIFAFVDMLKILFSRKHYADASKLYVLIPLLLSLFIADFFEARIMFVFGPFSVLLWVFFGYTMYYCEKTQCEDGTNVLERRVLYRLFRRLTRSKPKDGDVTTCTK